MSDKPTDLRRGCFVLQVKKDLVQEFLHAHQNVWPEYLEALISAGFDSYSSFISPDGLFVGYFESRDPTATLARLGATEIDQKWQLEMARFWEPQAGSDQASVKSLLQEAFNLENALQDP